MNVKDGWRPVWQAECGRCGVLRVQTSKTPAALCPKCGKTKMVWENIGKALRETDYEVFMDAKRNQQMLMSGIAVLPERFDVAGRRTNVA